MKNDYRSIVNLSGVEKVAAFFIALGIEKSAPLLREFDEVELERITVEIARLKNLPSQVAARTFLINSLALPPPKALSSMSLAKSIPPCVTYFSAIIIS